MTDEQARADAQYAGPTAPQLGNPAEDPPLTIRVHPDDDPKSPDARRVVKTDRPGGGLWLQLTGPTGGAIGFGCHHETVAGWPVQHWLLAATTYGHAAAEERRRAQAEQAIERGDMDVVAFKG